MYNVETVKNYKNVPNPKSLEISIRFERKKSKLCTTDHKQYLNNSTGNPAASAVLLFVRNILSPSSQRLHCSLIAQFRKPVMHKIQNTSHKQVSFLWILELYPV